MYVNDLSRKKNPENRELKVKLRYDLCETAYPQIKIVNPPPTYKVIKEIVEQKTKEMEEEKKLLINVRISESKNLETGNSSKEEECKQVQKNIKNTEKKEKKVEKQSNQKKVPVKNIVISRKRKNFIESLSDDNGVTDVDTLTCLPFAVPKPKVKRVYKSKKVFL